MGQGGGVLQFLPIIILTILVAAMLCYFMAKNKGLNAKYYFFFGLIPLYGFLLPYLILSKPNQFIMDKLAEIENKLDSL